MCGGFIFVFPTLHTLSLLPLTLLTTYYVCFQITINRSQGASSSILSNFSFQQWTSVKKCAANVTFKHPLSNLYSDFVAKNYVNIKKVNPELPILVREASGIEARAFARFGKELEIYIYYCFEI